MVLLGPLAASAAWGQEWYVGGGGGFGFAPGLNVSAPAGSATTGFNNGFAAGGFLGADKNEAWGGEIRYLYRQSDLKLSSGGTSTSFSANTNIVNGDVLWHFRTPKSAQFRPFVAFGAGFKLIDGTGAESASQPLGQFAALTHTREAMIVGDAGAGIKANFGKSWQFRAEVRDYIGPSPKRVIAAAPGANISAVANDIIFSVSIAYRY